MTRFRLNEFELDECLGVGAVGSIYRATHTATGRVYAVKLLLPSVSEDPLIVSRFTREMTILERLRHPHIVEYFGNGRHENQLFYVMEWMPEATLKELLRRRGPLSAIEAIECGWQIASALQHAHNHGIVHRDLKPANVFLTADGDLKLGDFGIARDLRAPDLTRSGVLVGTYAYMAPELIRGDRFITGKVDLYGLGCVLFECLTGRPPFGGENFAQILDQHLHAAVPAVRIREGGRMPELERLVQQLLAKDSEQRPFNARTIQGRLGALAERATGQRIDRALPGATDVAAAEVRDGRARLISRIRSAGIRHVSWGRMALLLLLLAGLVAAAVSLGL